MALHPQSHSSQSTDAENSKAAPSVSRPGDDLKTSSLGPLQQIARDNANQNTVTGSGGDNPGAIIKGS